MSDITYGSKTMNSWTSQESVAPFIKAVVSDGSYGIPKGLIFGFPLRTNSNGKIEIIQGIELNEFAQTKIKVTTEELESERVAVSDLIG